MQGCYSQLITQRLMYNNFDDYSPVFGTMYKYMMSIHYELGQSREVKKLYNERKESSIINKEEIIEAARYEGIIR